MTLSQIEILVILAKERNFTKTAEKLGITQPAVSLAIKKLENELDIKLISRETKNFQLTRAGENILIYCHQIIKELENIRKETRSKKKGPVGRLILGSVWSVNNTLLPKFINSFKREHSEIDISIFEGLDNEIENWLHENTIDIGITGWKNDAFHQEMISSDRYVVVISKQHSLRNRKVIEPYELQHFPLISSRDGCGPLISEIAEYHNLELDIQYDAREISTILSMTRENLGIAIFPELAIPRGYTGLKYIPLNTSLKRRIWLNYNNNNAEKYEVLLFVKHVRKFTNTT
ncbi:MAG TPA: LysR family transcriptional regulator [Eudoraea sp.]|nr:LysR family transcriptional regulator [Eudoraea sp.]